MRLFLLIFGFLITSEVYLLAAEAGMPQLDPTYWASQGFWLILIFTFNGVFINRSSSEPLIGFNASCD